MSARNTESVTRKRARLRRVDLLRFIAGYQEAKGYTPSYREMAAAIGGSLSGVSRDLDELERVGVVRRLENRARVVEVLQRPPLPRAHDGDPLYFVRVAA